MKISQIEEIEPLKGIDILEYQCEKCGTEVAIKKSKWKANPKLWCRKCKIEQTNLERYGFSYPLQNRKKFKQILKEKYGSETYNNREKYRATCLEKYGAESHLGSKQIREKIKATNLEKYGVEHNWSSQELRKHGRATCLEKYGSETWNNPEKVKQVCERLYGGMGTGSPILAERIKQTNLKKYGIENQIASEQTKEKIQKTILSRYNVDKIFKAPTIQQSIKKTLAAKPIEYWEERARKASLTRAKLPPINGIYVDSVWELNFVKTHKGCKRGPCIEYSHNRKLCKWHIDFEWNGALYEVKNPFYFDLNYPKWKPEITWAKWKAGQKLNVRWYIWNPIKPNDLLAQQIGEDQKLLRAYLQKKSP